MPMAFRCCAARPIGHVRGFSKVDEFATFFSRLWHMCDDAKVDHLAQQCGMPFGYPADQRPHFRQHVRRALTGAGRAD